MPRIFDNLSDDTRLIRALRDVLDGANRLDACVGYFNLRGWGALVACPQTPTCLRSKPGW